MEANLVTAAKIGDRSKVLQLLSKNADIEQRDKDTGWTPLNVASQNGHFDVVNVLLEKKASTEAAKK
eukprot:CAMPEP_0185254844 /NCGR_PEP_ID=MMETSP1359-20130426/3788_1 /TAXON_ID=552665 /ORGANISM="Bigelowiella longifila, Strain CCMP242" /LENGTH=66 /DNA_ID=CAMNT_0027838277 /DNA_START=34 /DNA_END=231 /DNA_ORIENTATION=+